MSTKKYLIVADIGGTHIFSTIFDKERNSILTDTGKSVLIDSRGTAEHIFLGWAEAINYSISKIAKENINGISLAIPGAFDYGKGIAKYDEVNDKYGALYNKHIQTEFTPYLNIDEEVEFRYLNDATSFAVGEAFFGAGENVKKIIAITLGTGFGSAFINDKIPQRKGKGVPLEGSLWHLPYKDGINDDYVSTRFLIDHYKKHGFESDSVKEIAESVRNNSLSQDGFEKYGFHIANILTSWVKEFEAEKLIIGGSVSGAFDLFEPSLNNFFQQKNIKIEITKSILLDNAALMGCAMLFHESFWDLVKNDLPEL